VVTRNIQTRCFSAEICIGLRSTADNTIHVQLNNRLRWSLMNQDANTLSAVACMAAYHTADCERTVVRFLVRN